MCRQPTLWPMPIGSLGGRATITRWSGLSSYSPRSFVESFSRGRQRTCDERSAVQPTETIVIVPVVPIDEVYGAVNPAVGGSGMFPCMVMVKLWSPEILRMLPSRL